MTERRIVCAALLDFTGQLILGPRHFDHVMREAIRKLPSYSTPWRQGFIDQMGEFLTREEAYRVASAAGQIIRQVGNDAGCLYSENIY